MKHRLFLFSLCAGLITSTFFASAQGNGKANTTDVTTAKYRVKNLPFNSKNSDFGLFPFGSNSFFFSSNRENENGVNAKQVYNWNNLPFLDIYVINKSGDTTFGTPIALPGDVEAKFNEGPVFYDAASNTFFITRNQYDKKKREQSRYGVNRLKIYIENIDGTTFKSFGEFEHNNSSYSVGHAALSSDGKRLYFSSDMPGGIGGVDLYVCVKEADKWGAPRNLGTAVNTIGNEMFPFIGADDKLYFSSNGFSIQTGLDIYCVERNGDEYKNLKKLDAPINSDQDDFSFYIYPDSKTGYLSSNRAGGKGDDDIYFFELDNPAINISVSDDKGKPLPFAKVKIMDDDLKAREFTTDSSGKFKYEAKWLNDYTVMANHPGFTTASKSVKTSKDKTVFEMQFNLTKEEYGLAGLVINKDNNAGVPGASISLINKTSGKITTAVSDDNGAFNFDVKPNNDYIIKVEKSKFMTANIPVSTKGMGIGVKKQNVMLEELVVGKSIKIDNVYYDQGKWDIRADAKPELDKMVALMNENPSMEVELSSHTDSRGSDASNMTLSDKRANSVVNYIVSKGIAGKRLIAKGYGESKLLNGCINGKKCSDAEHQTNRRTEFKILKIQ